MQSGLLDSKFDRFDQVNDLFEVLYARRAVSPYDRHSGEICFPGGKLDKDEDEIEAASREVNEEIGLDVSDSSRFLYLGKLTDQLFTYYRKQQDVKVSVMLYLAADQDMKMTINPDEVDTAFWVPINSFFSYGPSNLEQERATVKKSVVLNALLKDEHSQWIDKNDAEMIKVIATEKFIFKYPSVTYPLWGLTMLMTSTLVQTWMNPLIDTHPMNKGKDFVLKAQYFNIDAEDEELSAKLNNECVFAASARLCGCSETTDCRDKGRLRDWRFALGPNGEGGFHSRSNCWPSAHARRNCITKYMDSSCVLNFGLCQPSNGRC